MKESFLKIIALLIIVGLNWTGLSAVIETVAYFNDTENSSENSFSAGTLGFSLRSGQGNFVPPAVAGDMGPGDSVSRDIYIKNIGTLPFRYKAQSAPENDNCDLGFYEVLKLKVWYNYYHSYEPYNPSYHKNRTMVLKYDGPLKDFEINSDGADSELQIPNSYPHFENNFYQENEHWLYFLIVYPDDAEELEGQSCEFNFIFDAWQKNLSYGQGFYDTGQISSVLVDSLTVRNDNDDEMEIPEIEFSEDGFSQTGPSQSELPEFEAVETTSASIEGAVVAPAKTEEIEEIEETGEQEVGGEEELESQDENYESGAVNQESDETPAEEPAEEEGGFDSDVDVDTELVQEQPGDEEEPVDAPEVIEVDDGGDSGDSGDSEGETESEAGVEEPVGEDAVGETISE